jgi:hypothetical protein
MSIPDVILTPLDFSETQKAGKRRFWKQILPVTSIDYNGTKIVFDKNFHKDLQLSFTQGAYDQVPLVFADSDNRHNMDPRNYGGELLDLQYRGEGKSGGTWGLIEADRDTAKVLDKNPKLGVSARILQNIRKADGRGFKRAINHVLLTMNPRVSGMEPWQAVDLSEASDIEVVDLTAAEYTQEGIPMAKTTRKSGKRDIDLSELSDEEFQNLLDLAVEEGVIDPEADPDEDEEEDEEDEAKAKPKRRRSKTKVTVEKDEEDDDGVDDDEDEDETDLSEKVIARGEVTQFQQMRIDLAEERWERTRDQYEEAGVPPFLLDLAAPVLSQPDPMTIDLSDDETVNASEIVKKMLDGVKGIVDLSDEIGHQHEIDLADEDDDTKALLSEWSENYG